MFARFKQFTSKEASNMKKTSIVLTGVGGQGVITAANILAKAAVKAKVPVFASEVHGMAQRGGTVNSTVRMGDISGPLVPNGGADVILSMEPVEGLRYITFANKKTIVITDTNPVVPFTVAVGGEQYPKLEDIYKEIRSNAKLYTIDALQLAKDAGSSIVKNTVMLGALAGANILPFSADIVLETILENVPKKYQQINKDGFAKGKQAFLTYKK